jgi:hypothetical protein
MARHSGCGLRPPSLVELRRTRSSRSLSSGACSRDPLAPRNDVETYIRGLAAPCARGFARKFLTLQSEGAGNTGCTLHPRSREQIAQQKTPTSIQVQRRQSGIPCAMVLTVYSVLSPVSRALLPPSPALLSANLMPASGHQDHTPSPYASAPFVIGASASTAARPASVTIANRPSEWGGMANHVRVIWVGPQALFRKYRIILGCRTWP